MTDPNGSSTAYYAGGRLGDVNATSANVDRASVRSVEADQATLERAAVRRLHAQQATVEKSAIAFARIEHATLRESNTAILIGRSVAADQSRTGILIAPIVRGEVHTLVDMRSAVAIGLGIVLGRVLLGGVRALGRRVAS
jgi:hypothetical protein